MAVTLNLVPGQHLTLTPQLRQAIAFLQLSTLELNQAVAAALQDNPLLELQEPEEDYSADQEPDEFRWDSLISSEEGWDASAEPTLTDFLLEQAHCLPLSERDTVLITWLIGCLDNDGFLSEGLESAAAAFPATEEVIEPEEWRTALSLLQSFEPAGIGAQTVNESLLIQLRALSAESAVSPGIRALTEEVIRNHLPLVAKHKYEDLRSSLSCSPDELRQVLEHLGKLTPHPASAFCGEHISFIIPEVRIYKHAGKWHARLADTTSSRLRLNNDYARAVLQSNDLSSQQTWKNRLSEARELLKNIEQRQNTLLRVAEAILEHQKDFFEQGAGALRPLVLRQIAEEIEMHESTVSRACSGKYLLCPFGVFELKYFFSSSLPAADGQSNVSSSAVKSVIKQLIESEDKRKPLSDAKLVERLNAEGYTVARRTVAKYREALGLPPAAERKQLK